MKSLELAKTVHTLAEAMGTIRARILDGKWAMAEEHEELQATWRSLETEILRLLPLSDQHFLETKIGSLLGTGSFELLGAIQSLGLATQRFELNKARLRGIFGEGPQYFATLVACGMGHTRERPEDPRSFINQLMDECRHGTDAEAWREAVLTWTPFILGEVLHWVQHQELALPKGMSVFLAELVRRQIERHPTQAATMANQSKSDVIVFNVSCLFLAGFTIPDRILRPRPDVADFAPLIARLASNHGRLMLQGQLGSLEVHLDPATRKSLRFPHHAS